jgi:hypothetical protein
MSAPSKALSWEANESFGYIRRRIITTKNLGGYRLVVLFDGFSYPHWIPIPAVLDNLLYAGKAPLEDRRFDRQSAGVSNVGTAIQLGIRAVLEQGITAVDS